jgi:hypothetical protein
MNSLLFKYLAKEKHKISDTVDFAYFEIFYLKEFKVG